MTKIEIYTSPLCPYCWRAKRLLERKGLAYLEIDVFAQPKQREVMRARANGRHTVPQIFINDRPIGGSDDLVALDAKGELDALLGSTAGAQAL